MRIRVVASVWVAFLLSCALPSRAAEDTGSQELQGVPISYRLPTDGSLPKPFRVTLAITAPGEPDWIVCTFLSGAERTVTEENQGKFTDYWNGWDDNYMPLPPGNYGVKGIYMPADIWEPDGKLHTLRAKLLGGPFGLTPKAADDPNSHRITGDPTNAGMGDVAVGPNGIAVFYWKYLENAENNYLVDLTKPIGPQQLQRGFNSGGAAGGLHTATDGETVWAVSPAGKLGLHMPPIVYRADGKPFGTGKGRYRKNVTLPQGYVTGLAASRDETSGRTLVYVAERGRIVESDKDRRGRSHYKESAEERVNLIRVLDGETGDEVKTIPVEEPQAIAVASGRLWVLQKLGETWGVRNLTDGSKLVMLGGLETPEDLAVDARGRFFIADPGKNQVFRFSPTGKLELAFGKQDRQRDGHYDPETFMTAARLALWKDAAGQQRLLIAEHDGPGRISEWSTRGELLRDWNGLNTFSNAAYNVDPRRPEDLYIRGQGETLLRYKVDYTTGAWTLNAVWHGIDGGRSTIPKHCGKYPQIIYTNGRKYLAFNRGHAVYRFDGERLVASAGIIREEIGPNHYVYYLWHDANGNGHRDPEEYRTRPMEVPAHVMRYWGDYWQDDLSMLALAEGTPDIYQMPVESFDDHGNPIFGQWKKYATDQIFAASGAGTADALHGANETADGFQSAWGCVRRLESGELLVNTRSNGFSANHAYQQKISRYVPERRLGLRPDQQRQGLRPDQEEREQRVGTESQPTEGGFRQKWRIGRCANIVPGTGAIVGSIHVTKPIHGLFGVVDQSLAGVHVFTWESGLYVDTLMLPGKFQDQSIYGSPGEFFAGDAHLADGKVILRWGKATPILFEIEGWNANHGIRPIEALPQNVGITPREIASPPELALQIRGGAGRAKFARFQPAPGGGPAIDGSLTGWDACEPVVFSGDRVEVEVRCAYDPGTVYLRWAVKSETPIAIPPLRPAERMFTHDRGATSLSFYLQGDPEAKGKAVAGRPGDVRLVFGLYEDGGKTLPAALGLYPRWVGLGKAVPFKYGSIVGETAFEHVGLIDSIRMAHQCAEDGKSFVLAAAIPRNVLPKRIPDLTGGWRTLANFGATFGGSQKIWWSDADGSANRETVDEPSEARLYPGSWTQAQFEPIANQPVRHWKVIGPFGFAELPSLDHREGRGEISRHLGIAKFPPEEALDFAAEYTGDMTQTRKTRRKLTWRDAPIPRELLDFREVARNGWKGYEDEGTFYAWSVIQSPTAFATGYEILDGHGHHAIRGWLNGEPLLIDTSNKRDLRELKHRIDTTKPLPLQAGENELLLRFDHIWGDPVVGLRLQAPPEILWQLRIGTDE